ncbi:MAG: hypothetical protein RLZZ479_826, partial [Bacteroidota bacterium]
GQNFVPFLNPHQWESHYIVLNNTWAQVRWANENGKETKAVFTGDLGNNDIPLLAICFNKDLSILIASDLF